MHLGSLTTWWYPLTWQCAEEDPLPTPGFFCRGWSSSEPHALLSHGTFITPTLNGRHAMRSFPAELVGGLKFSRILHVQGTPASRFCKNVSGCDKLCFSKTTLEKHLILEGKGTPRGFRTLAQFNTRMVLERGTEHSTKNTFGRFLGRSLHCGGVSLSFSLSWVKKVWVVGPAGALGLGWESTS